MFAQICPVHAKQKLHPTPPPQPPLADSDGNKAHLEHLNILFIKHYASSFGISNTASVQYCSKPNYSF